MRRRSRCWRRIARRRGVIAAGTCSIYLDAPWRSSPRREIAIAIRRTSSRASSALKFRNGEAIIIAFVEAAAMTRSVAGIKIMASSVGECWQGSRRPCKRVVPKTPLINSMPLWGVGRGQSQNVGDGSMRAMACALIDPNHLQRGRWAR